uniref:Uncharacterized protein LOC100185953 n=1 Tax=Phallusia mammillata TaxID=59560 RepID=A0A6F9DJ01_9ASCI|nr:uncharacterized protein LOC100185953 [Phallusia mammillata]
MDCCGSQLVRWGAMSCCYGHEFPPQIFNHFRDLCCNGNRVRAATPRVKYSKCCGETTSYDVRRHSCPCNDGRVLKMPASQTDCCSTVEGLLTPYSTKTQFCCNGEVGDNGVNFCCGSSGLGVIGEEVCCTDKLFPVVPPNRNLTACCNGEAYNPDQFICCDDAIVEIIEGADQCCAGIPYNVDKSICCQGNLLNRETEGTECCATFAFFPDKGSFCCNDQVYQSESSGGDTCCGDDFYYKDDGGLICCEGVLGLLRQGDSCCGTLPYFAETAICCDLRVSEKSLGNSCCRGNAYFPVDPDDDTRTSICCENGPFGPFKSPRCCGGEGYDVEGGTICCGERVYGKYSYPSCCVDIGFDARTHTCCGSTVYPNPNDSDQVACCGNGPYDKKTGLCCSGTNMTVPEGIHISKAKCCDVTGVYNEDTQVCCLGQIFDKTNRWTSRCCGAVMYQTDEQLCCEGDGFQEPMLHDFEFGIDNTKCCGTDLYNSSIDFCCNGILQRKTFDETGCCAGFVYDRTSFICCRDVLQPIGDSVPWQRAECCGGRCMYKGPQRCCNDRIYARNRRTDVTCETYVR